MSDTTQYPDSPCLFTGTDAAGYTHDRSVCLIDDDTVAFPSSLHWCNIAECVGDFTPLVPAPTEPSVDEMMIDILQRTNDCMVDVIYWLDSRARVWECRIGSGYSGTRTRFIGDTPLAAVRAAWEAVCKPGASHETQ